MKRRDFISTSAGIGAGTFLAGLTGRASIAQAQSKLPEKRFQVYKCKKCGTIVEILVPGEGFLGHCDEPMELLEEQVAEAALEKHVPVIEKMEGGYRVKVGSTAHPMTAAHYIMWIELIADSRIYRQYLNPGDEPVATFLVEADQVLAREYCNLHGLWRSE